MLCRRRRRGRRRRRRRGRRQKNVKKVFFRGRTSSGVLLAIADHWRAAKGEGRVSPAPERRKNLSPIWVIKFTAQIYYA